MNSTKLKQQAKRVTTMVGTQMMVAAATMHLLLIVQKELRVSVGMLGRGQSFYNL